MRLKGRENAAAVKLMRRIAEAAAVPRKGYGGFGERTMRRMVVGFKGKAGAGRFYVFLWGTRLLFGGNCAPALIPLVQPGKRPVGPERSAAALRPFVLFDFFRGATGFYAAFALWLCPVEERERNRAIGG
jgi:hypothetical protein